MNRVTRWITTALIASSWIIGGAALAGCGGSGPTGSDIAKTPEGATIKTATGDVVAVAAANKFKDAMALMIKHDRNNDWTDATCKATADAFMDAVSEQSGGDFLEAKYNAGVAYQRCKNDVEARKIFEEILSKKSEFHRARVQLALYDFEASNGKAVDKAIGEMKRAITDAKFQNVEALVNLAMLLMRRDGPTGGDGCDNDFACAKRSLRQALAINDSFMPAFNQLAVYYLESAKKKAGRKGTSSIKAASSSQKKADSQALELAALVCSQALRKNPTYAPVHNTFGLISAELGDLSSAARSFGTARKFDKKFFEAHMNYAAVNLQFRGFAQSEEAYRAAIKLRPKDYEAYLGLALAVRGQIDDTNFDKNVAEASKLLATAKSIDPERPETYYNEAILTQEFKARSGGGNAKPILLQAKALFQKFVDKAGSAEAFADSVKRANERMEDIDRIIKFNEQTAKEQARMEAERKRREAEDMKKKSDAKK